MLDKEYKPMYLWQKEFLSSLPSNKQKFMLALERGEGEIKVYKTYIYPSGHEKENLSYIERIVKFMLWAYGGYKFYLYGNNRISGGLRKIYSPNGERGFDYEFMGKVYGRNLEFIDVKESEFPQEKEIPLKASMEKKGYKIGFDAGGSDRKVTSTIDGEVVFDSEDIWFPKLNSDPEYHINGIKDSINRAKDALVGRVDAIGVSTAGIVVDNEIRVASLFLKVPEEVYPEKIVPIYKNLGKEYSCPVKVANDGDVAALAGAFSLGEGRILGIAMGTSEAAGYVDENFNIKGYLNELAFAPVDANINAPKDEWSGDKGVGSAYHSQDAVIRLAKELRIEINEELSPAEKLKSVQNLTNAGEKRGIEIFEKLGEYFGYSILWYQNFYPLKKVLLLGRVASGKGGDTLLIKAQEVLKIEGSDIEIVIPDEKSRRLGQSYTATLL